VIVETSNVAAEPRTWWASEDTPVRNAPRVAFLIDGRMTMLEMCIHFLLAREYIHVAAWGLSPELLLVRGKHHRAGEDGTAKQEELLAWLRAKGLEEQDLHFWQQCEELSVLNVLSYAVKKGVDVRILLWDTYDIPPFQPTQPPPKQVQETCEPAGILCLLDDSHKGILNHPLEALHQKTVVVDGHFAFVGGIDMMMENDGDYDRWDTKGHYFHNPLRIGKDGKMPHGWHDVHLLFEGPAVADVEQNFRRRWNAVVEAHEMSASLSLPNEPLEDLDEDVVGDIRMQVIRTIPNRTYPFVPEQGIATILETYKRAFANAQRSIYVENQYFWRRAFWGLENPVLGPPHGDMEELMQALADALARGVVVTLLLPDNPNVGREFTDDGLKYLWELAPKAVASGSLQAYTLGTAWQNEGVTQYRPIYVHAKVAIVDDQWITLGSANLNHRGMRDDTELNVALMHHRMAQGLRVLLMAEHLGLCDEDSLFRIIEVMGRVRLADELDHISGDLEIVWNNMQSLLGDPFAGMAMFAKQAKENYQAIKEGQPMVGHLLPYIPYYRAEDFGVAVHAVNGWLNALSEDQQPS
jgi:phosphatidylserine/phosphatidylglycerophosphate/cardiolipin synthase-like enzyme